MTLDCLIIGNGPTFTENIDFYRSYPAYKIGCNRIIYTDFQLDLYIVGDYALFKNTEYEHLKKIQTYPEVLLRDDETCCDYIDKIRRCLPPNVKFFRTDPYFDGNIKNEPAVFYRAHTVGIYLLQKALRKGFKDIALVGMDCCYAGQTALSPNLRKTQIADKFYRIGTESARTLPKNTTQRQK